MVPILVVDKLRAAVLLWSVLRKWVHRPAVVRLGHAPSRVAPDLAGPVPTEADAEHKLLGGHHRGRAPRGREGVVGDEEAAVPRVGPWCPGQQVAGDSALGQEEDPESVGRPLHRQDARVARPTLAAPHPLVGSAAKVLGVLRLALVIHVVPIRHASVLVDSTRAESARLSGVERSLGDVVVNVLQDVNLATIGPLLPWSKREEGGPDTASIGHVREAHDREEVGP
mmetsp:Transcript_88309/g.263371  ORF Transcript_88309/g.263371 Transcript_88309/m.263371 type:complete len:226 (-) Transcript_88309:890-1567(-)